MVPNLLAKNPPLQGLLLLLLQDCLPLQLMTSVRLCCVFPREPRTITLQLHTTLLNEAGTQRTTFTPHSGGPEQTSAWWRKGKGGSALSQTTRPNHMNWAISVDQSPRASPCRPALLGHTGRAWGFRARSQGRLVAPDRHRFMAVQVAGRPAIAGSAESLGGKMPSLHSPNTHQGQAAHTFSLVGG